MNLKRIQSKDALTVNRFHQLLSVHHLCMFDFDQSVEAKKVSHELHGYRGDITTATIKQNLQGVKL